MGEYKQYTSLQKNAHNNISVPKVTKKHNSNQSSIIMQQAKINSSSLSHEDVMQLQRTIGNQEVIQLLKNSKVIKDKSEVVQKKENHTGMPDNIKAGVESLSGISMDNVKVHYNSSKPAEVGALAYTQGSEIHVAPGQERHLPHEAWHVVQQAQGRVEPTMQLKGMTVNDDAGLEKEADAMGEKATQGMINKRSDIVGIHNSSMIKPIQKIGVWDIPQEKREKCTKFREFAKERKIDFDKILKLAPSYEVFEKFMGSLKDELKKLEFPPLGTVIKPQDLIANETEEFIKKYSSVQATGDKPLAVSVAKAPNVEILKIGTKSVASQPNIISGADYAQDWASILSFLDKKTKPEEISEIEKIDPTNISSKRTITFEIMISAKWTSKGEDKGKETVYKFLVHYHRGSEEPNPLHFKHITNGSLNYPVNWDHWLLKELKIKEDIFPEKQ